STRQPGRQSASREHEQERTFARDEQSREGTNGFHVRNRAQTCCAASSQSSLGEGKKGAHKMSRKRGCVYQREDSGVWWIKYSRHGKPFRESMGFVISTGNVKLDKRNKDKANQKLEERLAEITTGTFAGPRIQRYRVDELAEDFLR